MGNYFCITFSVLIFLIRLDQNHLKEQKNVMYNILTFCLMRKLQVTNTIRPIFLKRAFKSCLHWNLDKMF